MKKKEGFVYCWGWFLLLSLLAYWIQIHTYFHKDIAIILYTSKSLLGGKTYGHGIFEPNPPLIFYLYAIPLYLSSLLKWNIIYVFRLYVILLIFLSMGCCYVFLKVLWSQQRLWMRMMFFMLAFIFLFLPAEAFGQREHFLVILTVPYVFLAPLRLENKKIALALAWLVGGMAGIGFSIKPFFLIHFLLLELWVFYAAKVRFKKIKHGWRIESILALTIIICYGLFVILAYPDYFRIVLPLWMPYYKGIMQPWNAVLLYPGFVFCMAIVASSFFIRLPDAPIKSAFMVSLVGSLLIFLMPRVAWYYHLLPALSFASLYLTWMIMILATEMVGSVYRGLTQTMIGLLGIAFYSHPFGMSMVSTYYRIHHFYKSERMPLFVAFLNQHQPTNSYAFFSLTHEASVLTFYSSASYVGSLPFFGWEYARRLPGFSLKEKRAKQALVLSVINDDLDKKKPAFVLIEGLSARLRLNQFIDYISEFSTDPHFRQAWSHYKWVGVIEPYQIYQRV